MSETKKRRIGWVLAACLGAAGALGALGVHRGLAPAAAESPRGLAGWEYATLLLGDGPPVFSRRDSRVTITPGPGTPSGAVTSRRQGFEGYFLEVRSVRDVQVAALDVVGDEGWEAVSVTPTDDGLLVLLKRAPLH